MAFKYVDIYNFSNNSTYQEKKKNYWYYSDSFE